MGTNYYALLKNNKHDIYDEVSSLIEPKYTLLHIGKSSGGWCFTLHVPSEYDLYETEYEGSKINTLDDWKTLFEYCIIINECNEIISSEEMLSIITDRKSNIEGSFEEHVNKLERESKDPSSFFYSRGRFDRSEYIEGPNKLRRHKIGSFCIGHGEGTWDYVKGEFS